MPVVVNSSTGQSLVDESLASKELADVRRQLEEAGVRHDVRRLARGRDPAEELIATANDTGADLLVIGLRRRSPVGKLIMGSDVQRILLDAALPGAGGQGGRTLSPRLHGHPHGRRSRRGSRLDARG